MHKGKENRGRVNGIRKILAFLSWRILSIPIFLKIMGIGFLVAILFGSVTLLQTRTGTFRILSSLLEEKVITVTKTLANIVEEPARAGNTLSIQQHIDRVRTIYPEIRYVIVQYPDGRVMTSTFKTDIPPGVLNSDAPPCPPECGVRRYKNSEGTIYEARTPIFSGVAGTITVGFIDHIVSRELDAFTGKLLAGLLVCVSLGACLALLLTNILTRPIRSLVESANLIREGKFETRANVYSDDEIGRLAVAFNQMAEALNQYQQQVQAKEKARISLLERIVQVQEDERKSISRELHDHLGQSLLALLLQVQSFRSQREIPDSIAESIEASIRQATDEVHNLAWGMRPSILDDYGLDSALARHIDEISRHFKLKIDYSYSSPKNLERLPGRIEVCLFRIAQEAITNIQRHADASRASVVVLRQIHEITLLIEDDGIGFDLSMLDEKRDKCLGLIGMRERVALLGGSAVIESVPGEGTTIRIKIPLDGGSDAHTNTDSR
jgi:signal transduction histidine kinase